MSLFKDFLKHQFQKLKPEDIKEMVADGAKNFLADLGAGDIDADGHPDGPEAQEAIAEIVKGVTTLVRLGEAVKHKFEGDK